MFAQEGMRDGTEEGGGMRDSQWKRQDLGNQKTTPAREAGSLTADLHPCLLLSIPPSHPQFCSRTLALQSHLR